MKTQLMNRNEHMLVVKAGLAAVTGALDTILAPHGFQRTTTRRIREDFTPLLNEPNGPIAFVLSDPEQEWTACWSTLTPTSEWRLAETLARRLEQPVFYALFAAERDLYAYRYWDAGRLQAEALPRYHDSSLDEAGLLDVLAARHIPPTLIDDRRLRFATPHTVLGYLRDLVTASFGGQSLTAGLN
ncbi:MAG: hypothetical protein NVS4B8_17930 [Herpetosiphon sp.]